MFLSIFHYVWNVSAKSSNSEMQISPFHHIWTTIILHIMNSTSTDMLYYINI